MHNLTDDELNKLSTSNSEQEWNKVCDEVKDARSGGYPPDWYQKVLASGLATQKQLDWQAIHSPLPR